MNTHQVIERLSSNDPGEYPLTSCLPIVPSSRLWLPCLGIATPPMEWRFVDMFQAAWKRIPIAYRRDMVKWWREDEYAACYMAWSPQIHLVLRIDHTKAMGVCRGNGHLLQFRIDTVVLAHDEPLQTLVAHELSHVWQFSQDIIPKEYEPSGLGDPVEVGADDILQDWGFDPDNVLELRRVE